MPNDRFEWDETAIARIRTLWAEGHSTTEIGRRMGISKNAVVGKVHRLNLPGRASPILPKGSGATARQKKSATARAAERERARVRREDLAQLWQAEQAVTKAIVIGPVFTGTGSGSGTTTTMCDGVPQLVSTSNAFRRLGRVIECCWPLGEPGRRDFRFCCEPSVPNRPYCQTHAAVAYVRAPTAADAA